MTNDTILEETIAILCERLDDISDIEIERVVIGLFFTGVKLSTGHAGSAATPVKDIPEAVCCPSSAMEMPFPGKMRGRKAERFFEDALEGSGVRRALAIAVINALAQTAVSRHGSPGADLLHDLDAFEAVAVQPHETAVVVGAFVPFLRGLRAIGATHYVLEKDPTTLKPIEMPFYRPAEMAPEIVPLADVLLVTGTTLINGSLEGLLSLAKPDARVVVVGPTVTQIPDAFFRRGCHLVGGIEITDPDAFLDVLAEGGSGYHFFGRSARKIVLRRQASQALLLPAGASA